MSAGNIIRTILAMLISLFPQVAGLTMLAASTASSRLGTVSAPGVAMAPWSGM